MVKSTCRHFISFVKSVHFFIWHEMEPSFPPTFALIGQAHSVASSSVFASLQWYVDCCGTREYMCTQYKRKSPMHNANCGVMNNNNRHHFDSYFGRIFSFKTCVQRVGLWTISSNMSVGVSLRRLVCVCIRNLLWWNGDRDDIFCGSNWATWNPVHTHTYQIQSRIVAQVYFNLAIVRLLHAKGYMYWI